MKSKLVWDYEESKHKYYHIYSFDEDWTIEFEIPKRPIYDILIQRLCNTYNALVLEEMMREGNKNER